MSPPPQVPCRRFLTSFEPGGTERQMTELIRRLDRIGSTCTSPVFPPEARGCRASPSGGVDRAFPIQGFARPDDAGALRRSRAGAGASDRDRADVRSLREHLRPAGGGARRRAGAHRQPARAEPGQDAAQIAAAAQAYRSRTRSWRIGAAAAPQLEREGLARRIDSDDSERRGLRGASRKPRAPRRPIRRVVTVANLRPRRGTKRLIAGRAGVAALPRGASSRSSATARARQRSCA